MFVMWFDATMNPQSRGILLRTAPVALRHREQRRAQDEGDDAGAQGEFGGGGTGGDTTGTDRG